MKQTLRRLSKRTLALLLTLTLVLSLGTTCAWATDDDLYTVTVTASPAEGTAAGDTVTLTARVTKNGTEVTDLASEGLNFTFWADSWNEHSDGNSDAVITGEHSLTSSVTLPTAGTYYMVGELYDSGWTTLASDTVAITVTEAPAALAEIPLENGDFENGASNWTLQGFSEVVTASYASNNTTRMLNLWLSDSEAAAGSAAYTVFLTAGTYQFGFDLSGAEADSGLCYSVTAGETTLDSGAGTYGTTGWDRWTACQTETFTLSEETAVTFTLSGMVPAGYWGYLDNLTLCGTGSVVETEEPPVTAAIDVEKVSGLSDAFIMGVDISSVMAEFASGVTYRDFDGNTIDNITDFCRFLASCGVTHVRVRVWNDPFDSDGNGYGGGNNDVAAAVKIAAGCKEAGLKLLVDFHCSDFWCDPSKQQAPKAWQEYTLDEKAAALKTFLTDSLTQIQATGAEIAMVQVGNETTGSFIGETGAANMCALFQAGSEAVRAISSEIQVVIHITNPEKGNLTAWARNLDENEVDYDILATSYYPYWHGTLENLRSEMNEVRTAYKKDVMVAETSYAFTLNDTDGHENTVRAGSNDTDMAYSFSVQGQADCIRDTIAAVSEAGGLGVFYWEPAWITVGDTTGLTGDAYDAQVTANKAAWEQYGSGWASSYAVEYDPVDAGQWYGGSAVDNQALFAADGSPLASVNVWKYVRTGAISQYVTVEAIENPTETIEQGGAYHLPETVLVTYNKGPQQEAVAWDSADVAAVDGNTPGDYVVRGTVTLAPAFDAAYAGDPTAAVTYTLTVRYANLIADPNDAGFEKGGNFTIEGSGINLPAKDDPKEGSYSMHWWSATATAGTVTYDKPLTLQPGSYLFEAAAQGLAGDTVTLHILDTDGHVLFSGAPKTLTGWSDWQTPSVYFQLERETEVMLQVEVQMQDGGWGTVDCLYLHEASCEHVYDYVGRKAPTLLLPGYTGDFACKYCGQVLKEGDVIPALGSFVTPSVDTPDSPMDFSDVKPGDWFYDDVKYVYENGLMNGAGGSQFAPNTALTRGMLVTILYRMEGAPATRYNGMFSDVANYQWYTDAVEWAAKNEIVNGYGGGKFGPGDPVTREQLAAILFRYARYKGMNAVTLAENLTGFADCDQASSYAVPALNWAVGRNLLNGAGGKLLPQANATRAQVAAIIHRFLEG